MRKTVTITIGGLLFHIEEDAYQILDDYLSSIREHFASYKDHEEIVSDIESRIAEEFTDDLKDGKRAAITKSDVETLVQKMGTVEDFAAFEGAEHKHKAKEAEEGIASKRLYRDSDNRIIAGVAAGLANYIGIEPVTIRLIFGLSLLFGGAGVLVYIVLWIVMPEAKTASEQAEMRGLPLTIKRIEQTIREKIPHAKKKIETKTLSRFLRFPGILIRQIFIVIGKIITATVPLIGRLIGLVIIIASVGALLFLTFWFVMLMTGSWEQFMDVPMRELAGNLVYYTALVSSYIIAFIPLVLIVAIGLSLLQLKNAFRFHTVLGLVGVWMVALIVGAVTVAQEAPAFHNKIQAYVDAHDSSLTRDIDVSPFESLEVRGPYEVRLIEGDAYAMKVTGSAKAVEGLQTELKEDGTLIIYSTARRGFCIICLLRHRAAIDLTVTENIMNITADRSASIEADGIGIEGDTVSARAGSNITLENVSPVPQALTLEAMAGSSVEMDTAHTINVFHIAATAGSRAGFTGSAGEVNLQAQAGSRVTMNGSSDSLSALIAAGSRLEGETFQVREARVEASAGSRAVIHVTEKLTGFAHAGSTIRYTGNPTTIDIEDDPSGEVQRVGD